MCYLPLWKIYMNEKNRTGSGSSFFFFSIALTLYTFCQLRLRCNCCSCSIIAKWSKRICLWLFPASASLLGKNHVNHIIRVNLLIRNGSQIYQLSFLWNIRVYTLKSMIKAHKNNYFYLVARHQLNMRRINSNNIRDFMFYQLKIIMRLNMKKDGLIFPLQANIHRHFWKNNKLFILVYVFKFSELNTASILR